MALTVVKIEGENMELKFNMSDNEVASVMCAVLIVAVVVLIFTNPFQI